MTSRFNAQHGLSWGTGTRLLEVFLEPTCPFSVRAFNKLDSLLQQVGEENLTIRIILHSQPWHLFSGIVVRAVLAALTLPEGKQAAKAVLHAVADHREEFEFTDHCRGPNMDKTPSQIVSLLEQYSGVSLREAFEQPELQLLIKSHCKYSRQNGIHVSPTFMINGLIQPDMGSGEEISEWIKRLQQA
jgi:protein-disulfide isomerase